MVARSETKNLLPDSEERPGDVVMFGIGKGGGDLVIDVTVVDPFSGLTGLGAERRARTVGKAAEEAELRKRDKTGGANNETIETRVTAQGMEFRAIGFETFGAETTAIGKLLKKTQ